MVSSIRLILLITAEHFCCSERNSVLIYIILAICVVPGNYYAWYYLLFYFVFILVYILAYENVTIPFKMSIVDFAQTHIENPF